MWTKLDCLDSIKQAVAVLEEGNLPADRKRQIEGIVQVARRLVDVAPRVSVSLRYRFPSVTAADAEPGGRWVEIRAIEEIFCLEYWESNPSLDRPPTPTRVQEIKPQPGRAWEGLVADNTYAWLCRAENLRWIELRTE